MDERDEIARLLANLDLSQESEIREKLRQRLATQSKWVHGWALGFRYWAVFSAILILLIGWSINLQPSKTIADPYPQATAFASTRFPSQDSIQDIPPTLSMAPKPIPTPNTDFLTTSPLEYTPPSTTLSPINTPNMKTGYH